MSAFNATAPGYSAFIPAALSPTDARRLASEDSGQPPWMIRIEPAPLSSFRDALGGADHPLRSDPL